MVFSSREHYLAWSFRLQRYILRNYVETTLSGQAQIAMAWLRLHRAFILPAPLVCLTLKKIRRLSTARIREGAVVRVAKAGER
jgi:hypothetical protein